MEIVYSREHVNFLLSLQKILSFKISKNSKSLVIFFIIAFAHVVLISIALISKPQRNESPSYESLLQVMILQPKKVFPVVDSHVPELNIRSDASKLDFHIPDVTHIEIDKSYLDLSAVQPDAHYELPNKNANRFTDVFDPRLRKQLQENHQVVSKAKESKLKNWTRSDGTIMVETGDGTCISKLPDKNGVTSLWSMQLAGANCDKTQSEKMVDNINADLEARKHPLAQ